MLEPDGKVLHYGVYRYQGSLVRPHGFAELANLAISFCAVAASEAAKQAANRWTGAYPSSCAESHGAYYLPNGLRYRYCPCMLMLLLSAWTVQLTADCHTHSCC